MSIVLGDNIDYKGKKPLDSRMLFDTIADMKAYSENYLPDITLAFNKEDSKMYVFNRENDVDEDTGKWRIFESGEEPQIAVEDLTNYNYLTNRVEEHRMVLKWNSNTNKWDKLPEDCTQDQEGTQDFNNFDKGAKYRFNNCIVTNGHPAMFHLDRSGKIHGLLEVIETYSYNSSPTSNLGIVFQRFTTTNAGRMIQFTRRKAFGHNGTWSDWTMEQTSRQSLNRGKTYAFFGGSVCYNWNPFPNDDTGYSNEEILGVNSIRKRAISGAGWVAGNKIDNQITTELAETNPADVWVFWSSTNDHTAQVPIGDLDHKTDTTTVIGAMCNAIERVRTAKPTANILMTTPIRRFNNESGWNPYYDDGTTIPFYKYAEAVYTVANYYGIPVFDLWNNSGIDIKNYTTYMSDTIHPNSNGYKLFQRELCKFCADGHTGNSMPVTPMGEKDKANIIDGTEVKDLFGSTEEDIKIKTITDEIENDKAPLRNNEWAFRANVGYFTPVDQIGIQGKNIYSINLWDGRAGDVDVYTVNVGVTSGTLTLNQFPADPSAYEAASSKICTLHLLGDGQHRRFVLDGTDSNVTDINEDFVNEAGYVEIPTGYFLSFKDYSASGTGGPLYGGVEGMGRDVGFCYIDSDAARKFRPGNLAVGVSTVTETEGTGTTYAFDTYLRDEENNTLRSKEIEEAKKSVDNLFNVETVSTVKIGPGVDQASFISRNQAYGQTSTSGPFIMYDQRGIQGKKLYSIGIGCNTNIKGGSIDINISHLNNTGEVLTKASFPTNVEDFLPLCERLCTVTFPTNDGNKFYTFKLDGTDSRVSNINSNYVGDDGYIEIPVGYYIGLKTWNTNNAPAFTYSGNIVIDNPYAIGWAYYTSDGTTGTIAENATAMLGLQLNIIEGAEQKHYNFDDKLVTTIKHEEHMDFAPACETGGTKGLSAENYFLGNRIFFPTGPYNIEQYSMNGKYLRGISYVGVANTPVYFVLAHVEDNTIDYNGTKNSDCYAISTGTPENNYNGKALFKITPDANVDTSKPTIYKLDGTDSRVTILNTDLYNSEEGGFLFDKTWLLGINTMGFTNTNNTTPDGTYPAKYLRTTGYGFYSYNTTNPNVNNALSKDVNNSLMLTFYTDVDKTTYEEQINSKVIADLKEKVDSIDMVEVESPLKGKYISLIGDSISTYQGWSNVPPLSTSAAVYYPRGDVNNVNYTYWKMLVDRTGANLLVNNSWSGSTLCSQGTAPVIGTGANDRCHQLDKDGHLPDYIIINIGTNDFDRSFGLGTWNGRGEDFPANASTATATTFREAYAIMLARLQEYYPLAKIYCCTFPCGNRLARGINERNTNGVYLVEFNDAIREIATAFGCRVIDLASSGLNYRTLQTLFCDYNSSSQGGEGDALHPNIAGMERFYELIRGAMESESSNTSAATRKMLVDLRDTTITSPTNGQVLKYNSATSKWINANEEAQESATTNYRGMSVEQALDEEYKPVENLITDNTKVIDGFWFKEEGVCKINSTSIPEFQSFYIPVEEGKTYYTAAKMNNLWIAFLDENEQAVDSLTASGSAITIPTGQGIKYLSYPQRQAYKPVTIISEKPATFVGELDIYRMTSAGEQKMPFPSPRTNGNYYATDTAYTLGTPIWWADYTYNLEDSVIGIGEGFYILGVNTQDKTAIALNMSDKIYLFDIANNTFTQGDSPVTIPEEWKKNVQQHETPSGLHGAVRVDDENNYILRAEGLSDFVISKSTIKTRVESQSKVFENYTTASGMVWYYGSTAYLNMGVFSVRHRGPIVEKKSTEENNHWYGKSWYAYGTSMTDTTMNGYTVELQSLLGANLTNYGKGGSGIIPSLHGGTSADNTYTRVKRTTDGKTNADLITLEIIPNDMSGTLGTPTDNYADGQTETFCGCLNELLQYLQVNTNAQIVVLIATRSRYNYQDPTTKYPPESENATKWLQWTDAAKECCRRNCVPFIDGQSNCGLGYARVSGDNKYVRDQIHLTPLGAKNLGQYFYSQIKNIPLFYSA